MLKNFLLLALLLDKTAADPQALRLPKGLPPLFSLQAPLKSSKEVRERGGRGGVPPHTHNLRFLFPSFPPSPHSTTPHFQVVRAFLGGRLRGVGDALHPLELWGYRLEYVQCPADDFDYSISSLKEDLRSGIRLAKLYAVLTGVGKCGVTRCEGEVEGCSGIQLEFQVLSRVLRCREAFVDSSLPFTPPPCRIPPPAWPGQYLRAAPVPQPSH